MTSVYLGRAPDSFIQMLAIDNVDSVIPSRTGGYVAACADMLSARLRGEPCYYILTPGGLNGEKSVRQFIVEISRLAILAVLALVGVRVCQIGFSLESIGPRHGTLLRWRSRLLHVCAPRDAISIAYAKELNIKVTGSAPDLAMNIFSSDAVYMRPRGYVGLSFRIDKDESVSARVKEAVVSLCRTLSQDFGVICIAQVGRDVTFMRELHELVSSVRPGRLHFVDCHRNIDDALYAYGACDAVVSNRLHVLMLALRAGAVPTAVTVRDVDSKILGVFQMVGIDDRVVDIQSFDAKNLAGLLAPLNFDGKRWANELATFFDLILSPTPNSRL